ncbi:MAG: LysR substrate-binding domain-containing protein [Oligoflexia bacterium]|nr:LysR substrate-binding domain-containing protein [Oligoflexia bacterium]
MNISWLTLRDLEYLVAVAEHRHFGRAAESCHVSQPTLSAQIRKIEDFLELALFERNNKRVSVTERGVEIVRQARVVLDEAEKIAVLAKRAAEPMTGPFRLGAIATLGPYLIPHLLGPLKREFPRLELRLAEGLTDGLLEDLRAGRLDAVLAARTFDETGFEIQSLFDEPFVVLAPSSHPIAAKTEASASDLNASQMVLLADGHCLRDQALQLCPANRRGNIRDYHATSLETLRHLVATGTGYTLIPLLAVREDPKLKKLVRYVPLRGKSVGREIILVSRARSGRAPDVERLATFLRTCVPKVTFRDCRLT